MQVILLERVGRLGTIGDEVNVKDGFARNYLLPNGKALRATASNRTKFEAERETIEKRNEERRNSAAGVADGLNGASIVMIRQAGETGQLYGSVSSRDISDALADQDFEVLKSQIDLPLPIKTVGVHEVALTLHAEVQVSVNVNVARSDAEAERQGHGEDMSVVTFDDEVEEIVVDEEETEGEETEGEDVGSEDASVEDAGTEDSSEEEEKLADDA